MANLRGVFPGAFTAGNLLCGFLALIACINGHSVQASWLVILAAFLDGLDGFVAKVSKGATRFGIELDSLADVVSFGAGPAVIIYTLDLPFLGQWNWLIGAVFLLSATLRLARFNLSATREEKETFLGLPVPAAAVSIVSYIILSDAMYQGIRFQEFMVTMIIGYSLLMVSSIEFEARPHTFHTTKERLKMAYILTSILAVILWPHYAMFPATIGYVAHALLREGYSIIKQTRPLPLHRGRRKKGGQEDNE